MILAIWHWVCRYELAIVAGIVIAMAAEGHIRRGIHR